MRRLNGPLQLCNYTWKNWVNMKIREATPEDAAPIRQVARRSWHETYDDIIGEEAVEVKIDEWYDVADLKASIERDDSPMFVAVDTDVVGFVQGGPSEDGPGDAGLWRIYVSPSYWGAGIGTRLLNELCTALRSAGHDSVWLSVMKENDIGRAFYSKHGFETQDRRTAKLAGQEIRELILVKEL